MLELRVLGPPRISASNGRTVETLVRQSKRMALLAYLAAALPRGAHRRDKLVALFWPESDERHARAALNQALYVLRSRLGVRAIVTRGDDDVALDQREVWCDAVAFEAALEAGDPSEALALYRGDLLDGFFVADAPGFERWADEERNRLRHRASEGAWSLAGERAAAGDAVDAERWARRAADLLPADEAVVRRLMLFLHGLGDRAAAIRAYEAFAWRLTKEYELDPSAETQALAEAIRREQPESAALAPIELPLAPRGTPMPTPAHGKSRLRPLLVAVVVVAALTSGVVNWSRRGVRVSHPETRFTLSFDGVPAMAAGVGGTTIALSPNAEHLVYLGAAEPEPQLFLRRMDRIEATAIPYTQGATQPFFSPDGAWLGFVAGDRIRKVRLAGSPAIELCRVTASVLGASWGDDGSIVFATPGGLWRVDGGGEPEAIAQADTTNGEWYRWPELLPGSRAALLTVVSPAGFEIAAVSLTTGVVRRLGLTGTNPRFIEDGFVVFARRDGVLLAAPFDAKALRLTGPATVVAEGVHVGIAGVAKLGISRTGALAYVPASFQDAISIVDRAGRTRAVPLGAGGLSAPRFSPDGERIAASLSAGGPWPDVWVVDRKDGSKIRVTHDSGSVGPVAWSRDARRIAFGSKPGGRRPGFAIRWKAADGSDSGETLVGAAPGQFPVSFTPDGRALVYQRADATGRRDIWVLRLDGRRSSRPYLRGPADERAAALSPDGRWLAWVSDASGRDEVYVGAFPEPGDPLRLSRRGGWEPRWAPNGRELFYRTAEGMIAVAVVDSPYFDASPPELLFDDEHFVSSRTGAAYDVHPDGDHFAMIERGGRMGDVLVVLDWVQRLHDSGG